MDNIPEVTRVGFLDLQVCVPKDFTDKQAIEFAESNNPCGTEKGWTVRKEGDKGLSGNPERNQCSERKGCVHIMMDA